MKNRSIKICCAIAMIPALYACDKSLAKKLAGTYSGIYSYETISQTGHVDTVFISSFKVSEHEKEVIILNENVVTNHFAREWIVPVDVIRDGNKYAYGDPYHRTVQFKQDSIYCHVSVVVDGNYGNVFFKGVKIQ